jgi:hypothetical protein
MPHQFKIWIFHEVSNVCLATRKEIIDAQDILLVGEQSITKV